MQNNNVRGIEMKIQIETSVYNERRYSKPWIAKIEFDSSGQAKYLWGNFIGNPGDEGLLVLDNIEIGDIFAKGQKDLRRNKTSNDFFIFKDENNFEQVSKAEAFLLWERKNDN